MERICIQATQINLNQYFNSYNGSACSSICYKPTSVHNLMFKSKTDLVYHHTILIFHIQPAALRVK